MMNFVYQKEAGCDLCYLDRILTFARHSYIVLSHRILLTLSAPTAHITHVWCRPRCNCTAPAAAFGGMAAQALVPPMVAGALLAVALEKKYRDLSRDNFTFPNFTIFSQTNLQIGK